MRILLTLALFLSLGVTATPNLPQNLHFLENKGQITDQFYHSRNDIQFSVRSSGLTAFVGDGQIHYQFARAVAGTTFDPRKEHNPMSFDMYRLDMRLLNANVNAPVAASGKQDYYENYFLPDNINTLTAHTYQKVTYTNIYPNIDWVLYISENNLKHEFVIKPGGNPSDIQIQYRGATALGVNSDGQFFANTPLGNVTEAKPYSYQQDGKTVTSAYKLNGDVLSFEMGKYSGTLVIDPTVQWINTLTSNSNYDHTRGVAPSGTGSVYACGITVSTSNFATVGAHQYTYGSNDDGYVTKMNGAGVTQWTTYYGGGLQDYLYSITYDENNNYLYATGLAFSNNNIGTPGTQEPTSDMGTDGFIVKFDTNGVRMWGTYINGTTHNTFEGSRSIAHDEDGNVYVAGLIGGAGVATSGTHQTTYGGGIHDVLLSKYNSSGMRIWATYYGGNDDESRVAIAYKNGKVYISGTTLSNNAIATTGAYQTVKSTDEDAFVAKFDTTGNLVWGTYFGQNAPDEGWTNVIDNNNNIYIGGLTESTNLATSGVHQTTLSGDADGFVAKFSTSGNLLWCTYNGGSYDEYGCGLSYNAISDDVYFAGITSSSNNIGTSGSYQPTLLSGQSGFLSRFNNDGIRIWGTYLSNNTTNSQSSCTATDPNDIVYVGGMLYAQIFNPTVHKFYDCQQPVLSGVITGGDTVCANSSQMYVGTDALEASSYTWVLPSGWGGSSVTDTINTIAGQSGTIQFFAVNSCGNSDTLDMNVYVSTPQAIITVNFLDLSTTTTFNTYQWYYNGSPIGNATNQLHTATQDGSYYVVVTDILGCADTSNTITVSNVGVKNVGAHTFSIYPNPTNGNIGINATTEGIVVLQDIQGRDIAVYNVTKGDNQVTLPASLVNSIYLLKFSSEEGVSNLRLVLEK